MRLIRILLILCVAAVFMGCMPSIAPPTAPPIAPKTNNVSPPQERKDIIVRPNTLTAQQTNGAAEDTVIDLRGTSLMQAGTMQRVTINNATVVYVTLAGDHVAPGSGVWKYFQTVRTLSVPVAQRISGIHRYMHLFYEVNKHGVARHVPKKGWRSVQIGDTHIPIMLVRTNTPSYPAVNSTLASQTKAAPTPPTTSAPSTTAHASLTNNTQVVALMRKMFHDTPLLVRIAQCESENRHFESGVVLRGEINHQDVGIMQINLQWHAQDSKKMKLDVFDPYDNLVYAKYIFKRDGPRHWNASRGCWGKYEQRYITT